MSFTAAVHHRLTDMCGWNCGNRGTKQETQLVRGK